MRRRGILTPVCILAPRDWVDGDKFLLQVKLSYGPVSVVYPYPAPSPLKLVCGNNGKDEGSNVADEDDSFHENWQKAWAKLVLKE